MLLADLGDFLGGAIQGLSSPFKGSLRFLEGLAGTE